MKFKAAAFVLFLAIGCPALAAGIDGKWSAAIKAPDGTEVGLKFSFKAEAGKLTGQVTGPDGSVAAIKTGTIEGNRIAFVVDVDMGGQAMTIDYTGQLTGDELKLHFDFGGMPIDFVALRQR